jgi:hypothetical protein
MFRATKAVIVLACLTLTAGCSGSDPVVASNLPETGATTSAAAPATPAATEATNPLDGLSAKEVWQKTKADAAEAKSVHIAARLVDGKDKIALNLKLDSSGKAFGAMILNGDKMTIRRLGQTLYFKADRGFWTTNGDAATAKALANKWIMVKKSTAPDLKDLFDLTDLDSLLDDSLSLTRAEQKRLKLIDGIDIGTQKTVGLSDKRPSGEGEFQTLYVSATEPTLPVNFAVNEDKSQYMKFRGWGENFTVVAPKGAIDLSAAS